MQVLARLQSESTEGEKNYIIGGNACYCFVLFFVGKL